MVVVEEEEERCLSIAAAVIVVGGMAVRFPLPSSSVVAISHNSF